MERQIIRIDEEKCDGCGECCNGCPEGALQLIDGKARLVSEITCDGLGACVGTCPQGAITVEVREAAPYDERATLANIVPKGVNTLKAHLKHLHEHGQTAYLKEALGYLTEQRIPVPDYRPPSRRLESTGATAWPRHSSPASEPAEAGEVTRHHACPGSAPVVFRAAAAPRTSEGLTSQLTQWPVQLHLISPMNPVFNGADVLVAADCVAFAMADFNQRYLPGRKLVIACPKLDQGQEIYLDKLTALIDHAQVASITVMIMTVPCCGGLLRLVQMAAARASRKVPVKLMVVGTDGTVQRNEDVSGEPARFVMA